MPSHHNVTTTGPVGGSGDPGSGRAGGIPDGLLLTLLGVLLSSTVLVWSAAGLSALLATGSWPDGVSIGRSALAVRALIGDPADPAAAWPASDAAAMARPGLFWGVFIGQLMVLFTLALFVMSAVARRRARREARRRGVTQPPAPRTPTPGQETADLLTSGTSSPASAAPGSAPPPRPAPESEAPTPGTQAEKSDGAATALHPQPVETPPRRTVPEPAPPATTGQPVTPVSPVTPVVSASPPLPGRPTPGALLLRADNDPRDAVHAAEGPLVVVTSDPALWLDTVGAREKLGPTHLYDPCLLYTT
ncbi:type VI secretion protein, partial [Streptomyces durbertensis]|nr:type VI secretion protein [Streptomyces durbertensis]